MKSIFALLIMACFSQLAIAQTKGKFVIIIPEDGQSEVMIDKRLQAVYTAEELKDMANNNPHLIDSLNFALVNLYVLIDAPKPGDGLQSVQVEDMDNINILQLVKTYGLKREQEHNMYYPIEGTNKWILMLPGYLYKLRYQEHSTYK